MLNSKKNDVYETIADTSTICEIEQELDLREIRQLEEDLASCKKNYHEKYSKRISDKQYNKKFYDVDECELRDARTLIQNRNYKG